MRDTLALLCLIPPFLTHPCLTHHISPSRTDHRQDDQRVLSCMIGVAGTRERRHLEASSSIINHHPRLGFATPSSSSHARPHPHNTPTQGAAVLARPRWPRRPRRRARRTPSISPPAPSIIIVMVSLSSTILTLLTSNARVQHAAAFALATHRLHFFSTRRLPDLSFLSVARFRNGI